MRHIRLPLVLCTIAGAALSGCGGVKLRTPWEKTTAAAPVVVEATAPVRIDHYLLVALAGEGLLRESALRVPRRLRARRPRAGQRGTLDLDYGLNRIRQEEFVQSFDEHFHTPSPDTWRQAVPWCEQMGANRMVICKVAEYRQYWQDNRQIKRISFLAAIDDVPSASRVDRFQVVAEKEGPQSTFDDVEEEAAGRILAKIMGKTYTEPIARRSWWSRWLQ
jgi:hypothetical protein